MYTYASSYLLIYIAATSLEESHDIFENETEGIEILEQSFSINIVPERLILCDFQAFDEVLPISYYFVEARGAFRKMAKPGVIIKFDAKVN